jgi:hypothetical protein
MIKIVLLILLFLVFLIFFKSNKTINENFYQIDLASQNEAIKNSGKPYYIKNPAIVGDNENKGSDLTYAFVSQNPNSKEYYKIKDYVIGSRFEAGHDNEYKKITQIDLASHNESIKYSGKPYYIKKPAIVGDNENKGSDLTYAFVSQNPNSKEYYKIKDYVIGSRFEAGHDNEYKKITQCNYDTQYILKDFINLNSTSDPIVQASDRICDDLTLCNFDTQYISKKKTIKSDIECADFPKCDKLKKIVGNTKYTPGECKELGEIIIFIKINDTGNLFIKSKKYNGNLDKFDDNISIENYYSNLSSSEENFNIAMKTNAEFVIGLNKDTKEILNDIIPCYYTNDNYVCYLFDLRNVIIKNHFYTKHKYLNLSSIEKLYNNINGPLYLFVLGLKSNEPINIFNSKNVNFFVAYKNPDESNIDKTIYIYEYIKYDLNMFYEYNKAFAISKLTKNTKYISEFVNQILTTKVIPDYKNNLYNKSSSLFNTTIDSYYNGLKFNINQAKKSLIKCNFDAYGDSLFHCKDTCKNEPNCSTIDCNLICENCNNDTCLWTIKQKINVDLLSPDNIFVKGFSGNSLIKLTWMKPSSPSEILRYYIILSSPIDIELLQIYSLYNNTDLCEYIISNLENEKPYDIYIFAKNDIGVGKKSNKITIVPNNNSDLKMEDNDSYSNSIENYYKQKGQTVNLKKQASNYERNSVIHDLKNIIRTDLKIKVPTKSFIVNVF